MDKASLLNSTVATSPTSPASRTSSSSLARICSACLHASFHQGALATTSCITRLSTVSLIFHLRLPSLPSSIYATPSSPLALANISCASRLTSSMDVSCKFTRYHGSSSSSFHSFRFSRHCRIPLITTSGNSTSVPGSISILVTTSMVSTPSVT